MLLILLCAGLAAASSSDTVYSAFLRAVEAAARLTGEHPLLGMGLFVLLSAASAMLAFVSSAVFVPVALRVWGKALCLLLLWLGWTLGGMVAYSIGRSLGRPVVKSLLSASTLSRYEDRISHQTPFGLVLLFQLALPSEVPGYLLGLARYRFWKYLAGLMITELPYAVATVYVGASLLDRQRYILLGVGIAGAALAALAFGIFHRRLGSEAG